MASALSEVRSFSLGIIVSVVTSNVYAPEQPRGVTHRPSPRRQAGLIGLILLGIAAYLYANLFVLPSAPVLQGDDQVYFWMDAQRMLHGERPYSDFFQFTAPGTDVFFLMLFRLFGPRIWVLNMAVLALGVALAWVCFGVASQVLERGAAWLATLLYVILIFSKPLNATHHWFSILAIMGAVAAIMPERSPRRIVTAGGLLAVGSFFTQTHGFAALLAFAVFLVWEQLRATESRREILARLAFLVVGFSCVLFALNAYFIASVGLKPLWYEQITYVHRYSVRGLSIYDLGLPGSVSWRNLPRVGQQILVYVALPVIYLFSLFQLRPASRGSALYNHRNIALLSLVGAFLLAEVALSPNWLRVYAISMPGIILGVWMLSRMGRVRRYALGLVWTGIACLALAQTWARHHRQYVIADLPAGKAAVPVETYAELRWVVQHTQPGEFFFQAAWPGMYVPLGLRNPLFLDAVGATDQTRPEYVELATRQLEEKKVRFVMWSERLDDPRLVRSSEFHLEPLRAYLHNRYTRVMFFPSQDEVWERK